MVTPAEKSALQQTVTTLQIIVISMAGGLIMFAIGILLIGGASQPVGLDAEPQQLVLSYLVMFLLPVAIAVSMLFPRIAVGLQIRQLANTDSEERQHEEIPFEELRGWYMTKKLIAVAIMEGIGFFALVTYMVEGSWIVLPVVAVAMVAILTHFPTMMRVENWVDETRQHIAEQRMLAR